MIPFSIPARNTVQRTLYNDLGMAVQVLVQEAQEAGIHEASLDAGRLPKGIYIYKLEVGKLVMHRKMVIVQ